MSSYPSGIHYQPFYTIWGLTILLDLLHLLDILYNDKVLELPLQLIFCQW